MPKLIFTSRFHKSIAGGRGKLLSYMGTREGVERLAPKPSYDKPPTKEQQKLIEGLIKRMPSAKDYAEYKFYSDKPSKGSASEFITEFAERNAEHLTDFCRLVSYMGERLGVQKLGTHGLFSQYDEPIDLAKTAKAINEHEGNIWTHVISLKREDAERLGYNNADAWRSLVRRQLNTIAEAHRIDVSKLKWYAAYHDTSHHPHIHLLVYSTDVNQGYLTNRGIEKMRSAFANDIFRNEQYKIYRLQSELRQKLKGESNEVLQEYLTRARQIRQPSDALIQKFELLMQKLEQQKGKKTYGYLPRSVKKLVDDIAHDLAEDERIADIYDEWCDLNDMKSQVYTDKPRERVPLEHNPVFRSIKNDIIRAAIKTSQSSATANPTQKNLKISSAICGLISSLASLSVGKIRDWYSQKRRTVNKKALEEYEEAGKLYVPEEYDYHYDDEDQDDGFILQ